jgi:hypothetical protein
MSAYGSTSGTNGTSGTGGNGGYGNYRSNDGTGGGGGGGGYYGGGGSGGGYGGMSGGGGGSSYADPSVSNPTFQTGVESGNGNIVITFAQQSTATALTASTLSPQAGGTVTYTATVSPVPDGGTVAFSDNGTGIASCAAQPVDLSTGVATCAVIYPTIGTHPITAVYSGDAIFETSTSPLLTESVTPAGSTSTSLTSSANPSPLNQQVTYTATVTPVPDSGTVAFSDNGTVIPTCGVQPVSSSTGIATCSVTYPGYGTHPITAAYSGDPSYPSSSSGSLSEVIAAVPTTPTISNLPSAGTFGGGFTATVATTGDGTLSVTSNNTGVCTASGLVVSYVGIGTCSLTAQVAQGADYVAATGTLQTFAVGQAVASAPIISNLPTSGTFGGGFTATVATTGDGAVSVTSNNTGVCTVSGLTVTYVGVGTCSLTADVATGTDFTGADGGPQTFAVSQAVASTPTIANIPTSAAYGAGFTATVNTTGDGIVSVTSNDTAVCTVSGMDVSYVGVGTCSLTAHVAAGTDYAAADGTAQTFDVDQAVASTPTISNLPTTGTFGGGFTATVTTTGDGVESITSNDTGVCTVSGMDVSYVGVGTCSLTAHVAAGTDYAGADGTAQTFTVDQAVASTPTISNLPTSGTFGGGFTATVDTTGDGIVSVTSNDTGVCAVSDLTVTYVGVGTCSLTAHVATGIDYVGADGTAQTFAVSQAVASTPIISNVPTSAAYGGTFTATVDTTGDGIVSVTSNNTGVCTVSGMDVSYVGVGTCSLTADVATGTDYTGADGTAQTFTVDQYTASAPTISNLPTSGTFGGGFTATVSTTGDGVVSVTSNNTGACEVSDLTVTYVGVGTCSVTAHVATGIDYAGADGTAQTFAVDRTVASIPTITNLPARGTAGGTFTATVTTTGDGVESITSNDTGVCTVSGMDVSYVGAGNCSLTAHVAAGTDYFGAGGIPQTFAVDRAVPPTPTSSGYREVAADGGIFSFGDARFYGSTGAMTLNKPIVGMATTPDGKGYWLVASDGGVFSFGNAAFYGSTGGKTLNKPIVGMATTPDGKGYWLVASDGGVFSFGNAAFYGSTGGKTLNKPIVGMAAAPGGNGYWLVASDGGVFSFGGAKFKGSTGSTQLNKPIVGMAAAPGGNGYWLVASDGGVFSFGDTSFHGSTGAMTLNMPIVGMAATPDGKGYWLVASDGGIFSFGDATFHGSHGGTHLNQPVVGMAND